MEFKTRLARTVMQAMILLPALAHLNGCGNGNGMNGKVAEVRKTAEEQKRFLEDVGRKDISAEELTLLVREWRGLEEKLHDGLSGNGKKDTEAINLFYDRHDSIKNELVLLSGRCSIGWADIVDIRRTVSVYADDDGVRREARSLDGYFSEIDASRSVSLPPARTREIYRTLLDECAGKIGTEEKLMEFIRTEDGIYRGFLEEMRNAGDDECAEISEKTEKVVIGIMDAARNGSLDPAKTLTVMTRRTSRRMLQNAEACASDIITGRVTGQGRTDAWLLMVLQPFMSMDDLAVTTLSEAECGRLRRLAEQMPALLEKARQNGCSEVLLAFASPSSMIAEYLKQI